MKYWQLSSMARVGERGLLQRVASKQRQWEKYNIPEEQLNSMIESQDRSILDSVVEDDYALSVLSEIREPLYLSSDNRLRSRKFSPSDEALSLVECFRRYGGEVIEDTFEYGSTGPHNLSR